MRQISPITHNIQSVNQSNLNIQLSHFARSKCLILNARQQDKIYATRYTCKSQILMYVDTLGLRNRHRFHPSGRARNPIPNVFKYIRIKALQHFNGDLEKAMQRIGRINPINILQRLFPPYLIRPQRPRPAFIQIRRHVLCYFALRVSIRSLHFESS